MDRVARWITEHSRLIVAFFAAAAIVCAVLFFGVKVNYDMTAYLPADAESTVALQIMQEEFSASVPNARVMVPGLTLTQAQAMKYMGLLLSPRPRKIEAMMLYAVMNGIPIKQTVR